MAVFVGEAVGEAPAWAEGFDEVEWLVHGLCPLLAVPC